MIEIDGPLPKAQSFSTRNQRGVSIQLGCHYKIVPFIIRGEHYFEIASEPPGYGTYKTIARGKGTISIASATELVETHRRLSGMTAYRIR